ncbi:hypothetical protein MMPV_002460 [Pyropia vietnamensis]
MASADATGAAAVEVAARLTAPSYVPGGVVSVHLSLSARAPTPVAVEPSPSAAAVAAARSFTARTTSALSSALAAWTLGSGGRGTSPPTPASPMTTTAALAGRGRDGGGGGGSSSSSSGGGGGGGGGGAPSGAGGSGAVRLADAGESRERMRAVVDYVVVQLSGRWVAERAWANPGAHPPPPPPQGSGKAGDGSDAEAAGGGAMRTSGGGGFGGGGHLAGAAHGGSGGGRGGGGAVSGVASDPGGNLGGLGTTAAAAAAAAASASAGGAADNGPVPPWADLLDDAAASVRAPAVMSAAAGRRGGDTVGMGGRVGGGTAYGGQIFRSPSLVALAGETLPVGARAAVRVDCVLPDALPPSFRGTAIRYTYVLAVVVAVNGRPPHLLRLPVRIVTDVPYRGLGGRAGTGGGGSGSAAADDGTSDVIPVPAVVTPAATLAARSRNAFFLSADPAAGGWGASALHMRATRLPPAAPTDIETALALSLNGRLTPYRTDAELWKAPDNGEEEWEEGGLGIIRDVDTGTPTTPGAATATAAAAAAAPGSVSSAERSLGVSPTAAAAAAAAASGSPHPRVSARPLLPMYAIRKGDAALGRMLLPSRVHRLGDTVDAVFDFSSRTVACYRLLVRLEMQEHLRPGVARVGRSGGGGSSGGSGGGEDDSGGGTTAADGGGGTVAGVGTPANGAARGSGVVFRKIAGEHDEYVTHATRSHVSFALPHDAPVSFATSAVAVRWALHFVFITPTAAAVEAAAGREARLGKRGGGYSPSSAVEDERKPLMRRASPDDDAGGGGGGGGGARDLPVDPFFDDEDNGGWPPPLGAVPGAAAAAAAVGTWNGIAERETEVLRWTLPLTVTGHRWSRWGVRSAAAVSL